MRPHPVVMGALILILIVGTLLSLSFFAQDEGAGDYRQRGIFTAILTAIISILLVFLATGKFWFTHLWKKNSTHARHKQHSEFHPVNRDREFRQRTQSRR